MIQLHASGRVLRLCRARSATRAVAPIISANARGGDKAHFGHVRGSALHRLVAGVLEATRGPLFSAFLAEDRPAQSARLAARMAVLWLPSGDSGFSINRARKDVISEHISQFIWVGK